jgi:hypothetical protein
MKPSFLLFLLAVLYCLPGQAQQATWSFEMHGGTACNIPLPLVIRQENYPDIRLNARYSTRAFKLPVYWVWRISRISSGKTWEFEAVHHKLYLENNPGEVQNFSITHGYNILTVNHAAEILRAQKFPFFLRLGAGVVLAHPESSIRNQVLDQHEGIFGMGYYISGPVLNITLAKRFELGSRFFINAEIKCNPSYAWIPIAGGHADVWNIALEAALGVGLNFIKAGD